MAATPRRIAAIDIGTNSIHLLVAEVRERGYRVVDREKEMVQLGLSSLDGQPLTDDAIDRGVAALRKMAGMAADWKADEIIAVATSAVREAPNRRQFLERVRNEAGLTVRLISGEEEADFIFRAVRSAVDLTGRTVLCLDIGGGSMEIIVGTESETYFTSSLPLGALRLAQRFSLDRSADRKDLRRCRRHVAERLAPIRRRVRQIGVDLVVGTSGTILTLAELAGNGGPADAPTSALRLLTRESIRTLLTGLAAGSAAERAERFGVDEKRARSLFAGAVILDEAMKLLGADSLLACPLGMREGIIESRLAALTRTRRKGDSVRRHSASQFARRTDCDLRHAVHVARLATRIFDQTRELHELPDPARDLLECAALLHESGRHVSERGHHKHSYYLIRHGDLRGFTEEQLTVVANIARYHRKAPPARGHRNLDELTPDQRTQVERLSAILRIAEGLDRGHQQRVRDVAIRNGRNRVRFIARTRSDASIEIESATRRARYFASLFEKKVRFDAI